MNLQYPAMSLSAWNAEADRMKPQAVGVTAPQVAFFNGLLKRVQEPAHKG